MRYKHRVALPTFFKMIQPYRTAEISAPGLPSYELFPLTKEEASDTQFIRHWQSRLGRLSEDDESPFLTWATEHHIGKYRIFWQHPTHMIEEVTYIDFEKENDAILFKMYWL